jgi:hypothetical protein
MRSVLLAGLLVTAAVLNVGCIVPIYSSNPDIRARELIFTSENLRHIPEIWERAWFLDMPDTETPFRTYGGVI